MAYRITVLKNGSVDMVIGPFQTKHRAEAMAKRFRNLDVHNTREFEVQSLLPPDTAVARINEDNRNIDRHKLEEAREAQQAALKTKGNLSFS